MEPKLDRGARCAQMSPVVFCQQLSAFRNRAPEFDCGQGLHMRWCDMEFGCPISSSNEISLDILEIGSNSKFN